MTQLIGPSDPLYFTETSGGSYDRHDYQLVFDNGNKSVIFDDYEQMRAYWFECVRNWGNCVVNVLDKETKKETKGFK